MDSGLEKLRQELLAFREARDWEQFHTPRNLATSVAVEAAELRVREETAAEGLRRDVDAAEEEALKAQRGVWHPDNAEELRILRGSD